MTATRFAEFSDNARVRPWPAQCPRAETPRLRYFAQKRRKTASNLFEIDAIRVQLRQQMERAMGIELHPKFLSLTGTRCYQPLCESIVAKCCQKQDTGGHRDRRQLHGGSTCTDSECLPIFDKPGAGSR
jgi:hypothetical protein